MKSVVTFNKSGSGSVSGKITVPVPFLEVLQITEKDREIELKLVGNQIIVQKTTDSSKGRVSEELLNRGYRVGKVLLNKCDNKNNFLANFLKITDGSRNVALAKEVIIGCSVVAEDTIPEIFLSSNEVVFQNWDLVLMYLSGVYTAMMK
jgi:bifunctional DNA-binding transcriptional regulator/antitoxin component of YhaV-PrlF toxin-antitoxin module